MSTGLVKIEDLIGKTVVRIKTDNDGDWFVRLVLDDGTVYRMEHQQECCEDVYLQDTIGNLDDLIGSPIVMAEAVTSEENPDGVDPKLIEYQDSFTWTFYKLGTVKGYVTLRFYGESNGFYGEEVDIIKE